MNVADDVCLRLENDISTPNWTFDIPIHNYAFGFDGSVNLRPPRNHERGAVELALDLATGGSAASPFGPSLQHPSTSRGQIGRPGHFRLRLACAGCGSGQFGTASSGCSADGRTECCSSRLSRQSAAATFSGSMLRSCHHDASLPVVWTW